MPFKSLSARTLAAAATAAIAAVVLALSLASTQATHDAGAMAAMALDMDPGGSPANTATSIGSREFCARIDQDSTLNADEDAVDAVQVDVTAEAIPAETAMIAYSYTLVYDETALTVQSHDMNFLLASAPGSSLFDAGDSTPDTDGNGKWTATAADVSIDSAESGTGTLDRGTVGVDAGASTGLYRLKLTDAGHVDGANESHGAEFVSDGFVAVGQACPLEKPTPLPTPTPSPSPPPPAIVRGTVRDQDGNPVPGAQVFAWDSTAADGTYELTLPPGSYQLYASAPNYDEEYWTSTGGTPDQAQAEVIEVFYGTVIEGIDFSLNKWPVISGTVRDAQGNPLAHAVVSVPIGDAAVADETGQYDLPVSALGHHLLYAEKPGYLAEYWTSAGGTPDQGFAETVTLSSYGEVLTGYDFTLSAKARLRGTVTDNLGNPLEDATIELLPVDGGWCECAWGHSDAGGTYEVIGINPGTYRIHVTKWGYAHEYWTSAGGTPDWAQAELVALSGDEVREGLNFQLGRLAVIRGRVTDTQGNPIANAWVSASTCWCWVPTDENGLYDISSVSPGDAAVSAGGWEYQTMYWTSTGSVAETTAAESISVSLDQVVEGIDLVLPRLARISGTVTDSQGTPISDAEIRYTTDVNEWGQYLARSNGDGTYGGYLDSGTYIFSAWSDGFATTYWTSTGGVSDPQEAETVTVALEEDRSGVDFTLLRFGSISGRVTDSAGAPVPNAEVTASRPTCCSYANRYTDENGYFQLEGLSTGDYEVSLHRHPWERYYWNSSGGSDNPNSAELVSVSLDTDASNTDFVLPELARLSGLVTDNAGNPLADAWVDIRRITDTGYYDYFDNTHTNADGSYHFELASGTYSVGAGGAHYQQEWWTAGGGVTDASGADRLAVEFGSTTEGIDFSLSRFGELTGAVRDRHGNPVPDAEVSISPYSCCSYWLDITESDGSFRIIDIEPGEYFVSLRATGIETTYWTSSGGSPDSGVAEEVAINYDQVTAGIDFVVNRLGKVTGRVTDSSGNPIDGTYVDVKNPDGSWCEQCQSGWTGWNGNGVFTAYAPSGRFIAFAWNGDYVSEYWSSGGGAPDAQTAEAISVDYESESVADFQLARLGVIQGILKDNHGSPLGGYSIHGQGPSWGFAHASEDGTYSMDHLSPGPYVLSFYYHDRQFFWNAAGGSFEESEAQPVEIGGDQVLSGIDFVVPRIGSITGIVTNSAGEPLQGLIIHAEGIWDTRAYTEFDGSYDLLVHSGDYTVWAEDYYERTYDTMYWSSTGGTFDPALAEAISADYDTVIADIDFTLHERGAISGVVTDTGGNPLADVNVQVVSSGCCDSPWARTAADGTFTIPRVASGPHSVYAHKEGYVLRYWNTTGGSDNQDGAEPVQVQFEQTTTGIDFTLLRAGTISGHLTNTAGEPVSSVYVAASGPTCCPYDYADSDGNYEITIYYPGAYKLHAWRSPGSYSTEYWTSSGGTGDWAQAEPIYVPLETDITGIDFVLKRPGAISGAVRDNAGNPIPNATLTYSGPACDGCARSVDSGGNFTMSYLYPGEYTVKASRPDYQAEFWTSDGGDPAEGETITIPEGETVAGIDFSLSKLGSISGAVTGPGGAPIAGASVIYDSRYCEDCNGPTTDADGKFTVDRIPPAGYVLKVTAPGMAPEYWTSGSGTNDEDRAQVVALGDGQALDGINFRLLPEACAPGDVTGDTRVDVIDIVVVARALGSKPGKHRWNDDADVNGDGKVNVRDLALVIKAFRSPECR